jgi:hypothetical protein
LKTILLLLCLFACAAAGAAAGDDRKKEGKHPDLSGTWALDKSKSSYGEARGRDISKANSTLIIEHRGTELRIKKTVVFKGQQETKQYAYYTDGRGESNPMAYGPGEVESKTVWDGDKVKAYTRVGGGNHWSGYYLATEQQWRLSDDGRTLTHTINSVNPGGEGSAQVIKLVYRRVG